MMNNIVPRKKFIQALILGIFVTMLWASSWVFVKKGLGTIPPLTFCGLRYSLAALFLLPFLWKDRRVMMSIPKTQSGLVMLQGFLFITITQGSQFIALKYLPATTVNLVLSLSTVGAMFVGARFLGERPTPLQLLGVFLIPIGALLYFGEHIETNKFFIFGIGASLIALFGNVSSSILGRSLNRRSLLSPVTLCAMTMLTGGPILLAFGLFLEDWKMDGRSLTIVLWLAIINTALAFTLWNKVQQILTAGETSALNSTLIVQIPILAVLFLGDVLSTWQIIGLVVVGIGIFIVQMSRLHHSKTTLDK